MKDKISGRIKDYIRLMFLSAQLVAGRRFWIVILLPVLWPLLQVFFLLVGLREKGFEPMNAQALMELPLTVIAIGLGVRIIADEIDRRTLEIAYTVPGGCHRIWLAKIAACFCLLFSSLIILSIVIAVFLTEFPFVSFYGALQAAVFYMVMGMAFSALFRSEITGIMASVTLLALNGLFSSFGGNRIRISPFFNPLAIKNGDAEVLFAWTVQNRILFVLLIIAITLLTFSRVEQREKMLGN